MKETRRDFLKGAAASAASAMLGGCANRIPSGAARMTPPKFMWAYLAHFGVKMWESRLHYTDLKVDDSMWKSLTERAAKVGVNVFVIDLGEGMVFPSHPELADKANAPIMGRGVVLKFNAAQRYTTDGVSASVFRRICGKVGVPLQSYTNRPDFKGGSNLGHISLTHVSVPTADIGLPQVAMHSCYETAAVADLAHLETAMTEFYSSALQVSRDGGCNIL